MTHFLGSSLRGIPSALVVSILLLQSLFASAASLFPCPDCGGKVSRRAVMCPDCGCPGAAILEAVKLDDETKRPKRLVSVSSDTQKGVAVLVQQGDFQYVVMDVFLLAGATTLNITELGTDKVISYSEPELAVDAPLLRFKIIGQPCAEFLPIPAALVMKEPSLLLNTNDQSTGSVQTADLAVAALNESGLLIALYAIGSWAPIHSGLSWAGVKPSDLRPQIDLLASAKKSSNKHALSENDSIALAGTNWLTPYLKNQSTVIIHTNKKTSEP